MPESPLYFEDRSHPNPFPGNGNKRGVAFQHENMFCALDLNVNDRVIVAGDADQGGLRAWVETMFGDREPIESGCPQGIYYKRIWRPSWPGPNYRSISQKRDAEKITGSLVALRILLNKLEELFETVEPSADNLLAYGHKIREILLLACMEVESSCAAVLKENGYAQVTPWKTNDYVKLLKPMLLDGYKLSLRSYPSFPPFAPFESWDAGNPTQSLSWYDAYNKTKHDREENIRLATLNNAVQAVGAAAVMFCAQFGISFGTGFLDKISPVIQDIFNLNPDFTRYEKSFYIAPVKAQGDGSMGLSFDWTPVDYTF